MGFLRKELTGGLVFCDWAGFEEFDCSLEDHDGLNLSALLFMDWRAYWERLRAHDHGGDEHDGYSQ